MSDTLHAPGTFCWFECGSLIVPPKTIPGVGLFCVFADPTSGVLASIVLEHLRRTVTECG